MSDSQESSAQTNNPSVSCPEAWQRAIRLLARRERTEADLAKGLSRHGHDAQSIDLVLARLRELGYVDDLRYARSWIASRTGPRALGRRRIEHELSAKGIGRAVIMTVLADLTAEQEQSSARAVARALCAKPGPVGSLQFRAKVHGALIRRGFDHQTAQEALAAALLEKRTDDSDSLDFLTKDGDRT